MSKRQRADKSHAAPTSWRGRSAVVLRNDEIEVIIVAGGGHIVSLRRIDGPLATVNALWEPPWPTTDPALRRLKAEGDLESMLLAGIGGANLCCDVFGEHSKGEQAAGLAFHGEAGLTTWEVEEWTESMGALVLSAHLRRSQLMIKRTFSLSGSAVAIKEDLTNRCGFERAMGRCQHVTIGTTMWSNFPNRKWPYNSELCTLRIDPAEKWGGFAASRQSELGELTLGCSWAREDFPWLMTWDENRARKHAPWNGRTLCRGLEISSYAFATSRRENVERGKLLGQPTFEWLDANETKTTTWYMSLQLGSGMQFGPEQREARELSRV